MICRNLERAEEAKNEIIKESGNDQIYIHIVDLSNLHDIQKFVQSFKEQYDKVNVLVSIFIIFFFFFFFFKII